MIKVLHVITELELGGAQKLTLEILKNLNSKKFKSYLLSSPKGLLVDDARNLKNTTVFLTSFLKREINPLYDLIVFFILFFYILKNKIKIIHTHSSKAGILGRWAAKLAGVPVIIHTYHGFGFNPQQEWIVRRFFVLLEILTSKITDKLIFVSKNNKTKAKKLRIGNEDKNILIYGAIEKEKFLHKIVDYKIIKDELGILENDKIVGMVGPLKPQKGPLDFVNIAARICDKYSKVKFILIGEGFFRKKVEREIDKRDLNNNVFLLGWRKDVEKFIPIFDVAILTSYWEGLPHFLLEAMVCRKPVVAFGVDGVCDIIKDGKNGFLISVGDIDDCSKKILKLLNNGFLVDEMGSYAYRMIKHRFNIDRMTSKVQRLYLNQIKNKVYS